MNWKRMLLWSLPLVVLPAAIVWIRSFHGPEKLETNLFAVDRIYTEPRADVWAARFLPGDTVIAAASVDSSVYLWNRNSGRLLRTLVHPAGLTNLSVSHDGRLLATSAYDGNVRLWEPATGRLVTTIAGNGRTVWTLQFSPDGNLIASAGEEGNINLYRVADGALVRRFEGHGRNVWDLAFSPDGSRLASGSFDATLCLWRVADGKLLSRHTDHTQAVVALAWSDDGSMLASTSDDKTVGIRNGQSGTTLRKLATPEHQQGVCFSPDGRQLITSGRDKDALGELVQNFFGDESGNKGVSMRLWDTQSGKLLQTFSAHANDVNDVRFSSDGRFIVSAGADRKVIVWKRVHEGL